MRPGANDNKARGLSNIRAGAVDVTRMQARPNDNKHTRMQARPRGAVEVTNTSTRTHTHS